MASSTPATTPEQARIELERRKNAVPQKKDGFLTSVVKDAAKTLIVKPGARIAEVVGRTGVLGDDIKRGYELMEENNETQRIFGIDIERQKAFGSGGGKQILGDAAKSASYLYTGGKLPGIAATTKLGKLAQGAIQGAKVGAVSGGLYGAGDELQQEDSTLGSVATSATVGALAGGVGGAVLGGILPAPVAAKNAPKAAREIAPGIMTKVARINPVAQEKFRRTTGRSVGEYLVERGIYGNDEEIMKQLAQRQLASKTEVDTAMAKLPGEHRSGAVNDMLKELGEREVRVSSPNVPSKDLARVQELAAKSDATGLTMSEINEIKRLYERNVRLGYLKVNNAEAVVKATSIDDAVRKWQFAKAEELGLKNLPELNKETQAAKMLGDEMWKYNTRQGANSTLSLTDAVLLAGGDPSSISMFLARQATKSKAFGSYVAKKVAPKPTVGLPKAEFTPATSATPQPVRTELQQSLPSNVLPPAKKTTPISTPDIRVTPEAVAKKLDQTDAVTLGRLADSPNDMNAFMEAGPLLEMIGVPANAPPEVQQRFIEEVLEQYLKLHP
jgi:uncharacterized protein YnzC (UPF0291/DUF896 family)